MEYNSLISFFTTNLIGREKMKKTVGLLALLAFVLIIAVSCGTTTSTSVNAEKGGSLNKNLHQTIDSPAIKKTISVAEFSTALSDVDSYAYRRAAYDTLVNKLQATGKFIVFEESAFDTLQNYIQSTGNSAIQKNLAQYMIVGSVNSVATKSSGGSFFGISTASKTVEASVTLRLIDTSTGQIIYSEEGQGNSNNTATSFSYKGASVRGSGYDPASLESKAIDAAIDSLIANIIETCDEDPWKTEIIADSGNFYIVGGESIGIKTGTTFDVYKKGGVIKNPQTGAEIELPGEKVGEAKVIMVFPGALPEDEISQITISGDVDIENIGNYNLREK